MYGVTFCFVFTHQTSESFMQKDIRDTLSNSWIRNTGVSENPAARAANSPYRSNNTPMQVSLGDINEMPAMILKDEMMTKKHELTETQVVIEVPIDFTEDRIRRHGTTTDSATADVFKHMKQQYGDDCIVKNISGHIRESLNHLGKRSTVVRGTLHNGKGVLQAYINRPTMLAFVIGGNNTYYNIGNIPSNYSGNYNAVISPMGAIEGDVVFLGNELQNSAIARTNLWYMNMTLDAFKETVGKQVVELDSSLYMNWGCVFVKYIVLLYERMIRIGDAKKKASDPKHKCLSEEDIRHSVWKSVSFEFQKVINMEGCNLKISKDRFGKLIDYICKIETENTMINTLISQLYMVLHIGAPNTHGTVELNDICDKNACAHFGNNPSVFKQTMLLQMSFLCVDLN